MRVSVRDATPEDFEFAFDAKRQALGPHIAKRWKWDENFQRNIHRERWGERPWSIIEMDGTLIGTLSIAEHADHIRFGEFYLLPSWQGRGIGSRLLQDVLDRADALVLPIKLEYLKWNPVGSLYRRNGFVPVSQTSTHIFLVRRPIR